MAPRQFARYCESGHSSFLLANFQRRGSTVGTARSLVPQRFSESLRPGAMLPEALANLPKASGQA